MPSFYGKPFNMDNSFLQSTCGLHLVPGNHSEASEPLWVGHLTWFLSLAPDGWGQGEQVGEGVTCSRAHS